MRKVFKLIGVLIVIPVLFCIASILAFYHLVRVGEVREFLRSEIQKRSELHTRLGEATLEIGWVTGIVFHDLALSEPGAAEPAITAAQIHARVALLPLLRREIVFYEIRVQRPKAQFVRDRSGRYPLIDKLLNLPFIKQQDSEFSLDLREPLRRYQIRMRRNRTLRQLLDRVLAVWFFDECSVTQTNPSAPPLPPTPHIGRRCGRTRCGVLARRAMEPFR